MITANKKERTYVLILSANNSDVTVMNPFRKEDVDGKVGQKLENTQTRMTFIATKKGENCTFGAVNVD